MLDFAGRVAVITGGGGVLCGTLAQALAQRGSNVVILDVNLAAAERVASAIQSTGGQAIALQVDVLRRTSLTACCEEALRSFGSVDILINGAGGTRKDAITSPTVSFFELPEEAIRGVFDLNFLGTFLACQVFGRCMVERGRGSILNIASVGGLRPLTTNVAYSAAKAAVISFTQWLAVHLSQEYNASIRVNAIAPGWILSEQNRFQLVDEETNEPTYRTRRIIDHTPVGRLGQPEDLIAPALMLLVETDGFIHGATLVVDGAYTAYGGV